MTTFEQFVQALREALLHLYDVAYQPPKVLCEVIGCASEDDMPSVQAAVLRAIEDLRPDSEVPCSSYTRRIYDLLHSRYVLRLTQEETAYQMHMSRRTINRLQQNAVHMLAGALWERGRTSQQMPTAIAPDGQPNVAPEEGTPPSWQSQVQRELQSLQTRAPDALADVEDVIASVLEFLGPLARERGGAIEVRFVRPELSAQIHPVVLSQVLIGILRRLMNHIVDRRISIYATLEDGNAKITLTGMTTGEGVRVADLLDGILAPDQISVDAYMDRTQIFVWIRVPSPGKITVLVADDNEDVAYFYRDATIGTRYHIVHTTEGQGLFEKITAVMPQIIVLDIMLPDIDGWRLLMRLHEDPRTRAIPVIVCSVVRDEELALSLGAASYLPKPIRPREFIQALDQALSRSVTGSSRSAESTVETC